MTNKVLRCLLMLLALLAVTGIAHGQTATVVPSAASAAQPGPSPSVAAYPWAELRRDQQALLAPLAAEWSKLPEAQRARWVEIANRYQALPLQEQERLRARVAEWAAMSPAQRQAARLRFQQSRQHKDQDREAKWQAYQALPAEQREALADKASRKKPAGPGRPQAGQAGAPVDNASVARSSGQPAAASTLLPLPPARNDEGLGAPTLMQARPGASTVLISKAAKPAPAASATLRIETDTHRIDARTLLPKKAAAAASQP